MSDNPTTPNPGSGTEPAMLRKPSDATVLVVDDEPNIRKLLAGVLQDEGYNVTTAADTAAATSARCPSWISVCATRPIMINCAMCW